MASIEQDIDVEMYDDDGMAGDNASDDMETSNYGTRSSQDLDSDSDIELTATMWVKLYLYVFRYLESNSIVTILIYKRSEILYLLENKLLSKNKLPWKISAY